ncbi:MAG: ATP-binding protein [Saprospiraceae bacterium]|nr:ATP-binding protein [Saprospiraceae bacterium]
MRKIVCTGPESSGKTTLAQALAGELHTLWAPEFARFYLSAQGPDYGFGALYYMMQGQLAWENWYYQMNQNHGRSWTVCDTDWTVFHIWEKWKYGTCRLTPIAQMPVKDRLYLLCQPDIAWEPDPLREHPEQRDALFRDYQRLLTDAGADFVIVKGEVKERLITALSEIRR